MADKSSDILICVEDPGAANMVVGLAEAINSLGKSTKLIAGGLAQSHLTAAGERFEGLAEGNSASEILDDVRPRAVAVGSSEDSDAFGLSLIDASRRKSLLTVGLIDGPANAAFRFKGQSTDPLAHAPGRIVVPDDPTARKYVELGMRKEMVIACGHPAFDRARAFAENQRTSHTKQFRHSLPGYDDTRPLWIFAAEISDGMDPEAFKRQKDYSLHGRGLSDDRTCIVLEEVLDFMASLSPRPYLILRLHPKNHRQEFAAFEQEIDFLSHGGDVLGLISAADLVIGMTSVLLAESIVAGTPAISIIPRAAEREWLLAADLIPAASDRKTVRELLSRPPSVSKSSLHRSISFGATDRIAEFLVTLAAKQ